MAGHSVTKDNLDLYILKCSKNGETCNAEITDDIRKNRKAELENNAKKWSEKIIAILLGSTSKPQSELKSLGDTVDEIITRKQIEYSVMCNSEILKKRMNSRQFQKFYIKALKRERNKSKSSN